MPAKEVWLAHWLAITAAPERIKQESFFIVFRLIGIEKCAKCANLGKLNAARYLP
jgi:hypothetical protein